VKTIGDLLQEHPFFADLSEDHRKLLEGCGQNVVIEADTPIFHEGQAADRFYVIRAGRVAIETKVPGRGSICIQTLEEGDVMGWSWLVPPYEWRFDATALSLVRAIVLDAQCLRNKCEADSNLGFELSKRFAQIMVERLSATRLQLLDLYGIAKER
jgi:CRP-like cAMP-binding protein